MGVSFGVAAGTSPADDDGTDDGVSATSGIHPMRSRDESTVGITTHGPGAILRSGTHTG